MGAVGRIFGSSNKKKRASFRMEDNQVREFTPPTAEEKKAMHGATDPDRIKVMVHHMPTYQKWRVLHDGEFIKKFADEYKANLKNGPIALQIIYAARVQHILQDLDQEKLRELLKVCFPNFKRSFPKLVKNGKDNKATFLKYVNKRLDDHAEKSGQYDYDHISKMERRCKPNELEHILSP